VSLLAGATPKCGRLILTHGRGSRERLPVLSQCTVNATNGHSAPISGPGGGSRGFLRWASNRLMQRSNLGLFDHLVGAADERRWHGEPDRLCGLEIDDEAESRRVLHR
jgi:hypothetical protein